MIYIVLIIFQIGAYAGAVCAQEEDTAAAPKPVSISSEATVEDILQAVDFDGDGFRGGSHLEMKRSSATCRITVALLECEAAAVLKCKLKLKVAALRQLTELSTVVGDQWLDHLVVQHRVRVLY